MKILKCGSLHHGYYLDYALDSVEWVGPRRSEFPSRCIHLFPSLSAWDRARVRRIVSPSFKGYLHDPPFKAVSMLAREEMEANLPKDWT
jgi:hypothetical protein